MSTTSFTNLKNGLTPVSCQKYNTKPPSRKLWNTENVQQRRDSGVNNKWLEIKNDAWNGIASPQVMDFSSFARNVELVSTPIPNFELHNAQCSTTDEENSAIITVLHKESEESLYNDNEQNKESVEQYVVHIVNPVKKGNNGLENGGKLEKPRTFELREKHGQEPKGNRVNKILEEHAKTRVFRAKPAPKFLKANLVPTIENTKTKAVQKKKILEIPVKKNNEIWKKKPFAPGTSKRNTTVAKSPRLSTATRAQQRKYFDDNLKEKEKQKEEAKKQETIIRKKEEEKEILQMRKQTVHKARPVPKYKVNLPKVEKRPLTDPVSPKSFKRRRHT